MRKHSKYHNKSTVVDGYKFASRKEANRYLELCLLVRAGKIQNLILQPRFELIVNGKRVGRYIADFQYNEDGKRIVEDVKSTVTAKNATYRLKVKLVKAIYGIEVREVL